MGRYCFTPNHTVLGSKSLGGHYVRIGDGPTCYKMGVEWIDTDNKVWGEPYHLYTPPPPPPQTDRKD